MWICFKKCDGDISNPIEEEAPLKKMTPDRMQYWTEVSIWGFIIWQVPFWKKTLQLDDGGDDYGEDGESPLVMMMMLVKAMMGLMMGMIPDGGNIRLALVFILPDD